MSSSLDSVMRDCTVHGGAEELMCATVATNLRKIELFVAEPIDRMPRPKRDRPKSPPQCQHCHRHSEHLQRSRSAPSPQEWKTGQPQPASRAIPLAPEVTRHNHMQAPPVLPSEVGATRAA